MAQWVYLFEGPGASQVSAKLMLSSLRRCLCPSSYNIQRISPQEIKKGDWQENCAALVLGGGYDLGYLKSLGPDGAALIHNYVMNGGTYIGTCAGAYYACDYVQFEKGSRMEVCGPRPLKFYPGKCQGSVVPDFTYNSERGSAALPITIPAKTIPGWDTTCTLHVYLNGGGSFSPYTTFNEFPHVRSVETLAKYDSFDGQPAAIVKCDVGERGGVALLSGPHIEYAAFELNPTDQYLMKIEKDLRNSDNIREAFFKAFLKEGKLRLRVNASL